MNMIANVVVAMTAQVALATVLYVALTVVRAPKIWGIGAARDGSHPLQVYEPRISANLSNQFEWPVLFFVACILLIDFRAVDTSAIWLSWIFVGGRVLHSLVQIFMTNIRLRGLVFMINFLAVLGLWLLVLFRVTALS